VLAGVLAMAASMTALATVVWSDFAEASVLPQVELADDVLAPQPVKMTKIEHKPAALADLLDALEMAQPMKKGKRKGGRLDFGSFEGY
jgi:hypothetical protein